MQKRTGFNCAQGTYFTVNETKSTRSCFKVTCHFDCMANNTQNHFTYFKRKLGQNVKHGSAWCDWRQLSKSVLLESVELRRLDTDLSVLSRFDQPLVFLWRWKTIMEGMCVSPWVSEGEKSNFAQRPHHNPSTLGSYETYGVLIATCAKPVVIAPTRCKSFRKSDKHILFDKSKKTCFSRTLQLPGISLITTLRPGKSKLWLTATKKCFKCIHWQHGWLTFAIAPQTKTLAAIATRYFSCYQNNFGWKAENFEKEVPMPSHPMLQKNKNTNNWLLNQFTDQCVIAVSSITGVPNLSLTTHPFSISTDEHVPLKFLMIKRLNEIRKIHWSFYRTFIFLAQER